MHSFWVALLLGSLIAAAGAQLFGGSCSDGNNCRHGTCVTGPIENTFWCRCQDGFGGDFCERRCTLECGDREKCSFDANGKEKCSCQGVECLRLRNVSTSNPCNGNPCNNGKCIPYNDGFMCICNDGFGGSYCDTGHDHCVDNMCQAGSKCVNQMNGYYCDCPTGRAGQFCERFNCNEMSGICNHGTCVDSPLSDKHFDCSCEPGFEGELCNMDKNECIVEDICLNNGTCINLPGSFRCQCPRGFSGKFCESRVDMCLFHKCENGGSCVHTERQEPVCQCKNGFVGKRCQEACPSGFGGERCDLPLHSPVCARNGGSCSNGGRCIRGFCVCPPDFVGNNCELRRNSLTKENSCASDPCMNHATCTDVDAHIGYVCTCQPGFEGDICERRTDFCAENPCANGGKCSQTRSTFSCSCPSGFRGERCDEKEKMSCGRNPCVNDGICVRVGDTAKCDCPYGFTGLKCEDRVVLTEPKESLIRNICEKRRCSLLSGNGHCDEECNQAACDFDGGDCSGGQNPFSKCPYALKCADVFANGVCNQECNNEECLYDGMDCMSAVVRCPAKIRKHCAARFGDGNCDPECNSIGCGFDGGDCAVNRTEVTILTDIRLKIQIDPVEFQSSGGQTLMEISTALRATVRIQRDEEGPLVFEWDGNDELGRLSMDVKKLTNLSVLSTRIRRIRSIDLYSMRGIVLYLEVEEICQFDCRFTTAQSVVDLISAGLAKTNGRTSLGLPITEAMVASPRRTDTSGWTRNQILLIVVISFLAFGTVVAGVIVKSNEPERSRKRKMVNAPVWMPPMDPAVEKSTRRNQSNHSSQRSLIESNGYYGGGGTKRHCGEYGKGMEYGVGQYDQIYPQTLANGFTGDFGAGAVVNEAHDSMKNIEFPPEEITLHQQASGPENITVPLTHESVNQMDCKYKRRVLHWLAANARGKPEDVITAEAVQCISAGADVNARDIDENTPLMLAVKARRVRLAVVLMRAGGNPTIYNSSERSALHEAVVNKDVRMLTILLTDKRLCKEIDELDRNGMTALMLVARSDGDYQVEMAKLLLSKGAKIDADGASRKDSEIYKGRTALHYAALVGNMSVLEFLVSRNSNKDKQDEAGKTPLMLAAKEGHEKAVKFLVDKDASLTTADAMDKTAAQLAQGNYHYEIAEYLRNMVVVRNRERQNALRQQVKVITTNGGLAKAGRVTFKTVKRAASQKPPAYSTSSSSRESNHLTPPPSDGSFSSPSPHYLHTTSSTPTALESSPEYGYHSDITPTTFMWNSTPSPYPDTTYIHPMVPTHPYSQTELMNNSFYC
uniref:Uncharacterized protein n=1 Tax=Caenorhabditis japonica TaxID=281687 RepID=A0A8R1DQT0_CAEJA